MISLGSGDKFYVDRVSKTKKDFGNNWCCLTALKGTAVSFYNISSMTRMILVTFYNISSMTRMILVTFYNISSMTRMILFFHQNMHEKLLDQNQSFAIIRLTITNMSQAYTHIWVFCHAMAGSRSTHVTSCVCLTKSWHNLHV